MIRTVNTYWIDSDRNHATEDNEKTTVAGKQIRARLLTNRVFTYKIRGTLFGGISSGQWNFVHAWFLIHVRHHSDWLVVQLGYTQAVPKYVTWFAWRLAAFHAKLRKPPFLHFVEMPVIFLQLILWFNQVAFRKLSSFASFVSWFVMLTLSGSTCSMFFCFTPDIP